MKYITTVYNLIFSFAINLFPIESLLLESDESEIYGSQLYRCYNFIMTDVTVYCDMISWIY